jgi:hypothetical protein
MENSEAKTPEERLEIRRMNSLTQARGIVQTLLYGVSPEKKLAEFQKLNIWSIAYKCEKYVENGVEVDDKDNVIGVKMKGD